MYKCSKMLFLDYSCSCYISSWEHRDTQYLGGNVVYVVSSPLAVLLFELSFVCFVECGELCSLEDVCVCVRALFLCAYLEDLL